MVQITSIFLDLSGYNLIFSSFFSPWLLMPKPFESLWAPYFPDCISHSPSSSTLNTPFKIFLLESTQVPPTFGKTISPCEPVVCPTADTKNHY